LTWLLALTGLLTILLTILVWRSVALLVGVVSCCQVCVGTFAVRARETRCGICICVARTSRALSSPLGVTQEIGSIRFTIPQPVRGSCSIRSGGGELAIYLASQIVQFFLCVAQLVGFTSEYAFGGSLHAAANVVDVGSGGTFDFAGLRVESAARKLAADIEQVFCVQLVGAAQGVVELF